MPSINHLVILVVHSKKQVHNCFLNVILTEDTVVSLIQVFLLPPQDIPCVEMITRSNQVKKP